MDHTGFTNELSNIINNRFEVEIHEWDVIKSVISHFITENYHGYGQNIVDFIDRGSWDRITSFQFKDANRQIEMKWHEGWLYHASVDSILVYGHKGMFLS